jgi:hypothetical protein
VSEFLIKNQLITRSDLLFSKEKHLVGITFLYFWTILNQIRLPRDLAGNFLRMDASIGCFPTPLSVAAFQSVYLSQWVLVPLGPQMSRPCFSKVPIYQIINSDVSWIDCLTYRLFIS